MDHAAEIPTGPARPPHALAALKWVALVAAAGALLAGRYDFAEAGGRYARLGYLSSLYFLVLVLPASYHLTLAFGSSRRLARIVCGLVFVAGAAPYHWLRLDRFRNVLAAVPWPTHTPHLAWLPGALHESGAPGERWLLAAMVGAFAIAALAGRRRRRRLWPWVALLALIALQTAAHTSMRSPYTYAPHFETHGKWYHRCLVAGEQGAVNADVPFFTSLDARFDGFPLYTHTLLIRRSFVHYLSSPFTYFFNPYYVYLVLNDLLWLAAVASLYFYARRLLASESQARLAAGLAASGLGFICFVAQPMSYVASFAIVIFVLHGFEVLMVRKDSDPLLFGLLLGLCAATYDLFPFFVVLLLYAPFRGVRWRPTLLSLALGLVIPLGFVALQFDVLRAPIELGNVDFISKAAFRLGQHLLHTGLTDWVELGEGATITVWQSLVYAFTLIATLLALAGVLCADRERRVLFGLLLLPAVAVEVFLFLGGVRWGRVALAALPRLAYCAYPAIYLAAALALDRGRSWLGRHLRSPLVRLAPWALVVFIAVLHNLDVFGHPELTYHFYWPTALECDPYAARGCTDLPSAF